MSKLAGASVKFNAIAKIHKYKGLHEGHHFILMAMEVHGALGRDMDCSLGSVPIFFAIDTCKVIYPCLFAFNFSSNVLILFLSMF
jgi:hypothetical protein